METSYITIHSYGILVTNICLGLQLRFCSYSYCDITSYINYAAAVWINDVFDFNK